MYNYTYTPVTVKVLCTILYSPENSLQWAAGSYSLNILTLNHDDASLWWPFASPNTKFLAPRTLLEERGDARDQTITLPCQTSKGALVSRCDPFQPRGCCAAAPPRFAWRAPRRAAASRQQGLTTLGKGARSASEMQS